MRRERLRRDQQRLNEQRVELQRLGEGEQRDGGENGDMGSDSCKDNSTRVFSSHACILIACHEVELLALQS